MPDERLIRDPVYDYIVLPAELAPIVDHRVYQRLRRVSQTSLTSMVYPAATGSRFEHGLGAMELAMRSVRAIWRNTDPATKNHLQTTMVEEIGSNRRIPIDLDQFGNFVQLVIGGVALLHDVGHPPYSHVLESTFASLADTYLAEHPDLLQLWEAFGGPFHEFAGIILAREILTEIKEPLRTVTQRVYEADPDSPTWSGSMHGLVSGEVDIDRLDYLMRDGRKMGTDFGEIDYHRLVETLELHEVEGGFRIAPNVRARSAVESLLIQRAQSYKWVSYHPRVVSSNLAIQRAAAEVLALARDRSEVRVNDTQLLLKEIFEPAIPNLNYLTPKYADCRILTRGSSALGGTSGSGQLTLTDESTAEFGDDLKLDMQAAVDDGVVLGMIKDAAILARFVIAKASLPSAVNQRLLRYLTYSDAVLHRRKNMVPVWKTVEELSGIAREMKLTLRATVEATFSEILQPGVNADIRAVFEQRYKHLLAELDQNPLIAFNEIVADLLPDPDIQQRLISRLTGIRHEIEGVNGFWDISYNEFAPVRTKRNLTTLYRENVPYSLLEHSPLVRALTDVERGRARLNLYFCLFSPATTSAWAASSTLDIRERLAADFIDLFPEFANANWPDVLRATFSD